MFRGKRKIEIMAYDPMGELLGAASGVDPYVGAALTLKHNPQQFNVPMPTVDRQMMTPQSQQVVFDLQKYREIQAMRAQAEATASVDRLSKVANQPTTLISIDSAVLLPLGIPAAGQLAIPFTTFNDVRITDFTVSAVVAPAFAIAGIAIGRLQLFQNVGAIPADRFTSDSRRPPLETPVLKAGTQGVITVQNIGGVLARFLGVFDAIDVSFRSPDCGR